MNDELLKKYARLAVEMGVNLKENDTLCINTPIETAEFARFIAEAAYAVGAKDVIVNIIDNTKNREALAIVNNENLSLAIGKKGINIKLASRLTKYRINVKTLDQVNAEGNEN